MTRNTGGSAFPFAIAVGGDAGIVTSDEMGVYGLTIRDYFAAKAMQARVSQPLPAEYKQVSRHQLADMIADLSYEMADAMLKARG